MAGHGEMSYLQTPNRVGYESRSPNVNFIYNTGETHWLRLFLMGISWYLTLISKL
ncbi:MAG: hypothetical protein ACI9ES_001029 [Oceanospirillaceae bacterium]|jgi:hypothetical protein